VDATPVDHQMGRSVLPETPVDQKVRMSGQHVSRIGQQHCFFFLWWRRCDLREEHPAPEQAENTPPESPEGWLSPEGCDGSPPSEL